jgi:hypothetical protein
MDFLLPKNSNLNTKIDSFNEKEDDNNDSSQNSGDNEEDFDNDNVFLEKKSSSNNDPKTVPNLNDLQFVRRPLVRIIPTTLVNINNNNNKIEKKSLIRYQTTPGTIETTKTDNKTVGLDRSTKSSDLSHIKDSNDGLTLINYLKNENIDKNNNNSSLIDEHQRMILVKLLNTIDAT